MVGWKSETNLTVPLLSARRSMICKFSKMLDTVEFKEYLYLHLRCNDWNI